jgi:L-alanine-DL-glutamate epimerase-like enolase superfamily enzyme
MVAVVALSAEPLDIELTEPFGIATGAQHLAQNVLVTLTLEDGSIGLGEAAPFPAVSGETQAHALAAIERALPHLIGKEAENFRSLAEALAPLTSDVPSARCAIETALLDALGRRQRRSLLDYFGGAEASLVSDITIPTGDVEHARRSALRAEARGFRMLKLKVGGTQTALDVARLRAVLDAAKSSSLVLDANASLAADEAIELVRSLGPDSARIALFEQPTAASDLEGLRRVRETTGLRVAADESARSVADVRRLAAEAAADVVNVKIMKLGIVGALEVIETARTANLGLMVGGMVESVLAMTTSACLAAGSGGFSYVDLDTPLFMRGAPFRHGMRYEGARIALDARKAGHGVERVR